MDYLIVSTLPKSDETAKRTIEELYQNLNVQDCVYIEEMNVHGCIGCNDCWLKTPGICTIKDDYEVLLKKFLENDAIVFITDLHYGFVSYKMKNLLDRILPLFTMYLKMENNQMRHYNRYNKKIDMGLLVRGKGDMEFLNRWMERVTLNCGSKSLGAYMMEDRMELYNGTDNN